MSSVQAKLHNLTMLTQDLGNVARELADVPKLEEPKDTLERLSTRAAELASEMLPALPLGTGPLWDAQSLGALASLSVQLRGYQSLGLGVESALRAQCWARIPADMLTVRDVPDARIRLNETVEDAAPRLSAIAAERNRSVVSEHNGVPVQAHPGETNAAIVERWQRQVVRVPTFGIAGEVAGALADERGRVRSASLVDAPVRPISEILAAINNDVRKGVDVLEHPREIEAFVMYCASDAERLSELTYGLHRRDNMPGTLTHWHTALDIAKPRPEVVKAQAPARAISSEPPAPAPTTARDRLTALLGQLFTRPKS